VLLSSARYIRNVLFAVPGLVGVDGDPPGAISIALEMESPNMLLVFLLRPLAFCARKIGKPSFIVLAFVIGPSFDRIGFSLKQSELLLKGSLPKLGFDVATLDLFLARPVLANAAGEGRMCANKLGGVDIRPGDSKLLVAAFGSVSPRRNWGRRDLCRGESGTEGLLMMVFLRGSVRGGPKGEVIVRG